MIPPNRDPNTDDFVTDLGIILPDLYEDESDDMRGELPKAQDRREDPLKELDFND